MKKNSLALLERALEHDQAGRLGEAEALYRSVLRDEPSNPDALHLLGVLELRRGNHAAAIDGISKAVGFSPKTALYQNNLGLAFQASGRFAEAIPCFQKAAKLESKLFDAHFNLGVVLQALDQIDEAIKAYEKALALGEDPGVLNNLGAAYLKRREVPKAIRCLERAAQLKPDYGDAFYNLGNALLEDGRAEAALVYLEKRAQLPNPSPGLSGQFAIALQQCGRLEQAESWYRQALQVKPSALLCSNLAVILEQRFGYLEAEQLLRQAIALQPDCPQAFNNLGNVLLGTGRVEESVLAYDHAINLKPDYVDAHYNRALARLTLGDFESGWNDYEYRWQWKGFPTPKPKFSQPEWTGDDLKGRTLLVYNEQGLGDTIQFVRYLPLAAARGGKVLFAGPSELKSLFKDLSGVSQMLAPNEPLPAFDVHAALMSLPRILGTRRDSIPRQVPYLNMPPADRFRMPDKVPGRLQVGIVWAGGARHPKDKLRSIALIEFIPILKKLSCDFFSLQTGPRAADLGALHPGIKFDDIGSRLNDFADTAAVIGQLDLLISADTATLHLAGALGRSVWGLLPYAPDWRWMLEREDSPWYPTLRLFRQRELGDWTEVLCRVAGELERLMRERRVGGGT